MGRNAKPVGSNKSHLTKNEIEQRSNNEEMLRGGIDKLKPPDHLNDRQREIFSFILSELEDVKLLGNVDLFVLTQTSIATERLEVFEQKINDDKKYLLNQKFMSAREKYSKEFFKCCGELSLTPQSRARLALKPQQQKTDLLSSILEDDDDDDDE